MTRSRYVLHHSAAGYAVKERTAGMLVWRSRAASATSAAYLVTFLSSHAIDLPAAQVRELLTAFDSDLDPVPGADEHTCPHCNVIGTEPGIKRHVQAKHADRAAS
jgi:hypothetical protein